MLFVPDVRRFTSREMSGTAPIRGRRSEEPHTLGPPGKAAVSFPMASPRSRLSSPFFGLVVSGHENESTAGTHARAFPPLPRRPRRVQVGGHSGRDRWRPADFDLRHRLGDRIQRRDDVREGQDAARGAEKRAGRIDNRSRSGRQGSQLPHHVEALQLLEATALFEERGQSDRRDPRPVLEQLQLGLRRKIRHKPERPGVREFLDNVQTARQGDQGLRRRENRREQGDLDRLQDRQQRHQGRVRLLRVRRFRDG